MHTARLNANLMQISSSETCNCIKPPTTTSAAWLALQEFIVSTKSWTSTCMSGSHLTVVSAQSKSFQSDLDYFQRPLGQDCGGDEMNKDDE